jgi:hypothetical protein
MKSNFYRKLLYMGIVLIIFVVTLFVRPPIERFRASQGLSDTELGDVDPTSSTMVLVLGGMRSVAANLLWTEAIEMQKEHDWANLEVVVKSIVKLEPHFISVWTFQGWNLAYNVSVEWDQVEDKYYWIKQGIKFVRNGSEVNQHSPELRWDTGWKYYHKIGKADESALLKKIYKADIAPEVDAQGRERAPFNPDEILLRDRMLPPAAASLDNYQTAGGWFQKAVDKCDQRKERPRRMGEVAFRSYPSHAKIGHAQSESDDGNFETAQQGWGDAFRLLEIFADHEYLYLDGKLTKLDYSAPIFSDMYRAVTLMTRTQSLADHAAKDWDKADPRELLEQVRLIEPEAMLNDLQQMDSSRRAELKQKWVRGVWEMIVRDTPDILRNFGQPTIDILPKGAGESLADAQKNFEKIKALDPNNLVADGTEAAQAAKQFEDFAAPAIKLGRYCHEELYWCDRYASMINFRYWRERTAAESELNTVDARRDFFTGFNKYLSGDLDIAYEKFKHGIELWEGVLNKYNRIREDDITAEETYKIVRAYQAVCQQLDIDMPTDQLPFQEYVRRFTRPQLTPEEYQQMVNAVNEMKQASTPEQAQEIQKKAMQKLEQIKSSQ